MALAACTIVAWLGLQLGCIFLLRALAQFLLVAKSEPIALAPCAIIQVRVVLRPQRHASHSICTCLRLRSDNSTDATVYKQGTQNLSTKCSSCNALMRHGAVRDALDIVDPGSTEAMPGHATAQQQCWVTPQHSSNAGSRSSTSPAAKETPKREVCVNLATVLKQCLQQRQHM